MSHSLGRAAILGLLFSGSALAAAPPISGSSLKLWLDSSDASTIVDASGKHPGDVGFAGTVTTWDDKSGNNDNATALNSDKPVYSASITNGQPVVSFNTVSPSTGTEGFSLASSIVTSQETMFFVTKMFDNGNNRGAWVSGSSNNYFENDSNRYFQVVSGQSPPNISGTAPTSFDVITQTRAPSSTTYGQFTVYNNGSDVGTSTGTASNPLNLNFTVNQVGTLPLSTPRYFYGQMAEVLIYNTTLNTAQRVITENYLSAKYETSALATKDEYTGDTTANGNHDFDVFGIGNDAATTLSPAGKQSTSSGDAISLTELNTSLNNNGEYLMAGHDTTAQGWTSSNAAGLFERWTRDYFLDVTTSDTIDAKLTFDFSLAGLGTPNPLDNYTLLYRSTATGTFSKLNLTGTVSGNTVSFNLLGLTNSSDGFYTLAVPEPASAALVAVGMALMLKRQRRA